MASEKQNGDKKGKATWHWSSNPLTKVDFVENPRENDVLFGRGAPFIRWQGNVAFRHLVNQRKDEYVATRNQAGKSAIVQEIIDEIQINKGGQFLIKQEEVGKQHDGFVWVPADKNLVFEKVKQSLRNKQHGDLLLDKQSEADGAKKRKSVALPKCPERASQTSRFDGSSVNRRAAETSSKPDVTQQSSKPSFRVPASVAPTSFVRTVVIPTHNSHQDQRESSFDMDPKLQDELALLKSNRSEGEGAHHHRLIDPSPYEESVNLRELRYQLALRRHVQQQQIRTHEMELELRRRRLELQLYDRMRAYPEQDLETNFGLYRSDTASLSIPGSSRLTDSLQQDLLQNQARQLLQQPRMTETPYAETNPTQLGNRASLDVATALLDVLRRKRNLLRPTTNMTENFLLGSLLRQQRTYIMEAVENGSADRGSAPFGLPRAVGDETSSLSSFRNKQRD